MPKINIVTQKVAMSKDAMLKDLKDGVDFTISDISHPNNGARCSLRELEEQGFTSAQIRYGKRNEKVWFGDLPKHDPTRVVVRS